MASSTTPTPPMRADSTVCGGSTNGSTGRPGGATSRITGCAATTNTASADRSVVISLQGAGFAAIGAQGGIGVQNAGNLHRKLEFGAQSVHARHDQPHEVVRGSRIGVRRTSTFGARAIAKVPVIVDDRRTLIARALHGDPEAIARSRRLGHLR